MGWDRRSSLVCAAGLLLSGCLQAPNADAMGSTGGETGTDSATDSQTGPGTTGTASESATGSTTMTTTTASTTDTTTSTSATTGGSTGEAGTSTGQVLPEGCYEEGFHPFAGTLCGPMENPCEVLVDEAASATFSFTNGSPSITYDANCDPQVLYSVAVGGFHGHFLQRNGDNDWGDEETSFEVARGGIVYDAVAQGWQAIVGNGAFGVSYWTRDSVGMWNDEGALAGQYSVYAKGVAGDGAGGLHVALMEGTSNAEYAAYDGNWTYSQLGGNATRPYLGLGSDAVPHLAWFSSEGGNGWELYYATPSSIPDVAIPFGSNGLSAFDHAVTVLPDGPQGDPRIVTAVSTGGSLVELTLLHLEGTTWMSDPFASEVAGSTCAQQPTTNGQTCDFDFTRYRPLDIVSSEGGDVRILYSEDHHLGTYASNCNGMFCFWETSVDNSEYAVHIAWPSGGGVSHTDVYSGDRFAGANAVVDDLGRIHLAGYSIDAAGDIVVRYLQLSD